MKKTDRSDLVRQALDGLTMEDLLRLELREAILGIGFRAVELLLEEERTAACGPRYRHASDREASRYGYAAGELILGGRRASVRRPRARTKDGREVSLPSWEHFSSTDPLDERAVEQMVVGVTTRKYERSLEGLPESVKARGTSKSAVSRRFVAMSQRKLEEWSQRSLADLPLAVIMIDGIHFADNVVLMALGIDDGGNKHVLGLQEGATENTATCSDLLTSLVERGVPTDRPLLFVIDGAKALSKAIRHTFGDRALVQRCQVHKKRNITERLPQGLRREVGRKISDAYNCGDAERAKRQLKALAKEFEESHPSAAASILEGLDETLTITSLGLPKALERSLSTTNAIENLNGTFRSISRNVKRWRGGKMILRWVATAADEASANFRRIKGHTGMPKLMEALSQHARDLDSAALAA